MAFNIIIRNVDENTFSINGGKLLNKSLYIPVLEEDRLGLKNKNTRKILLHPTDFSKWSKHGGEKFTSLKDLVEYVKTYITQVGKTPELQQSGDIMQKVLNNLILLNAKFDVLINALNNNTQN